VLSVTFVVGRGSCLVWEQQMGTCVPVVVDGEGKRHVLTDASTLGDLIGCLGRPAERAPAGDEMVHTFTILKNGVDASCILKTGQRLDLEICETNDA
jgi:hypothetical protein